MAHENDWAVGIDDAQHEEQSYDIERARDDVLDDAADLGVIEEGTLVLTGVLMLAIARWLVTAARQRHGAFPSPREARLQRDWDHLCRLDRDAFAADHQTGVPPIPLVLHNLAFTTHRCGVTFKHGVTQTPHPSGVDPYTGSYRSSPRPNCPGCAR